MNDDEFDYLFEKQKPMKTYTIEVDSRKYIRRKRKDDPITLIQAMGINDEIKARAIEYYKQILDPLPISEKEPNACVFWSVYVASRELKIPVTLDTIARISGLGMEKYENDVKTNPLDHGVKVGHKRITTIMTYFRTITPPFDMTPCGVHDFLDCIISEQMLNKHRDYIFNFLDELLLDEYWGDQNPNMLAYAILIFLSEIRSCPFYNYDIKFPIYFSKNIITDLKNKLNKLEIEVFSV